MAAVLAYVRYGEQHLWRSYKADDIRRVETDGAIWRGACEALGYEGGVGAHTQPTARARSTAWLELPVWGERA